MTEHSTTHNYAMSQLVIATSPGKEDATHTHTHTHSLFRSFHLEQTMAATISIPAARTR